MNKYASYISVIPFVIASCQQGKDGNKNLEKGAWAALYASLSCEKPFKAVEDLKNAKSKEFKAKVPCSYSDSFSATAVTSYNPGWFARNGYQYFTSDGLPFDGKNLQAVSRWRLSDMKLDSAKKGLKITASSYAETCYSGGSLSFLDAKSQIISSANIACRTKSTQTVYLPEDTYYMELDSGDWGVSVILESADAVKPCVKKFKGVVNLNKPDAVFPTVDYSCTASDAFTASAVKTNAASFPSGLDSVFGLSPIAAYITPTAKWKVSEMGFTGSVKIEFLSRADSCFDSPVLKQYDASGNLLSAVSLTCNASAAITSAIDSAADTIELLPGDWGVKVRISKL